MRGFLGAVVAVGLLFVASVADAADKTYPIDITVGQANAPSTVIEYFSLDCPHCAAFHAQVMPTIKEKLIDTGKIKLVLRDFPLSDVALAAALLAHCNPDRYYAFVNTMLASQGSWALAKDPVAALKTVARLGGLSEAQITACMANADMLIQIKARQNDAVKDLKVDGTPSFIIDGKKTTGEMSYDEFVKLIPGVTG